MSFGNNLRMIRKEKGITQEELADMLDVSRQAVSKWESEGGYPETDKLIVLA
ncbi:MAG: helix-turn-helix transcriptional regulator, partial [Lachnospiraceae bacterium]|nr:helix-turn-helix transcriptional regulator [Lachnospiraceae bacterium]